MIRSSALVGCRLGACESLNVTVLSLDLPLRGIGGTLVDRIRSTTGSASLSGHAIDRFGDLTATSAPPQADQRTAGEAETDSEPSDRA